jgi:CubicO group peptidase (beta-lactamase class C family)
MSAMTLAIAHSRGWLDHDERVARYWPEFAQHGKDAVTVRQLLAHQAGLFAFDEPVDRRVVADLDQLATMMARHTPAWALWHATGPRADPGRSRAGAAPPSRSTATFVTLRGGHAF